ncbi:hypothetical protein A2757_01685 [Candidatus Giovannonibacteria bacterium RIFCSPHIGHO2_01_FULL_48_47]|nr:MAG: hypothetical protein A2757_01685 [Candidatus Giovannonibacteria bacterium RIFCSPHIGHO2_01_FULL_48_47]OGF68415.1 MAG: hypothetical protein A3D61_00875 [Candidatus Giovannonibacteria bacterium RIFCSPHIGHO2_02_FULL_48_15]OGF88751.1 MAG: hypothetical protein A3B26_02970 [Candidatus Giovannonibacteria bacterium RIFCSPLOWO2_01_FULL_48_47]OGF94476.1 MAG: hypothetical protein A2433_00505 [Candidatus Giovannonibacteria bacterium RIFOXYC1_FULL_48_8]OGF96128.1 MAG: hypothetical protein A2613_00985
MRLTILIILLLAPFPIWADSVVIENDVSVSANTGGNTAEDGEIIQGISSVDVEVETIINGETVQDVQIHEELASPAGGSSTTPVVVEKKIESIVESATTSTNIKVELNKDDKNNKNEKSFLERIFSRLLFFLADFKHFFF